MVHLHGVSQRQQTPMALKLEGDLVGAAELVLDASAADLQKAASVMSKGLGVQVPASELQSLADWVLAQTGAFEREAGRLEKRLELGGLSPNDAGPLRWQIVELRERAARAVGFARPGATLSEVRKAIESGRQVSATRSTEVEREIAGLEARAADHSLDPTLREGFRQRAAHLRASGG